MDEKDRAGRPDDFPTRSPSQDTDAAKKRLRGEIGSASSAASEAAKAVKEEAGALAEDALHFAEDQSDKVKDATASQMDVFADALRAASDELGRNSTGPAAEMVTHAASGLENLSRSLHGKSTGEMLNSVRQFGRDNPVGFVAGSLLAGFALSRFAVAGMPSTTSSGKSASAEDAAMGRSNASPPSSGGTPQASARAGSGTPSGAATRPARGATQR